MLNLVIALLNSRRYRSASWIRANVAGYAEAPSDEAFGRMFERDKNELRMLQVPLETDGVDGYRIPPTEFSLPPLSFTPEETAAVGLAARLWTTTSLAGAGQQALRKIREAGAQNADSTGAVSKTVAGQHKSTGADNPDGADAGPMIPPETVLQPRVRTADPAFAPLQAAVLARRQVRFNYAKEPGDNPQRRSLQPWGLVSFRGRWYVIGNDLQRGAQRTFRLSRIVGPVSGTGKSGAYEVPTDVDLLEQVRRQATPVVRRWATIRALPGRAVGLRRDAELITAGDADGTGWQAADVLRIPMPWLWDTARRITASGPDVLVVEPDDLRDAVLHLLRGAAGQGAGSDIPRSDNPGSDNQGSDNQGSDNQGSDNQGSDNAEASG
ncbi:WYL domain-containing protein [Nakamurella sp. DB0629]|uniref:WYL domain-containing protein n=1 Tax=Nakamurella aerolata TaxID=1656892 RepID=A0A849A1N0_9ACTN|nr:WYL domain-containing protein [Nakamurella aerolata]